MPCAELSLTLPIVDVAPTGDADLVARLRQRERTAVAEAYTAHHAPVRAFARRLLGDDAAAEDVVHDTFLALPDAVAHFRGASTLRSFVIGVAANRARRHVRSAARRRRATQRLAEVERVRGAQAPAPDAVAQRRQLADRLALALDALAHDQRVAFVLCEVEERSAVEVAQILDVPEGTIRSRVFHARRRLRELLAEEARRG
ncbi:MAG: RNA polymerase sigma factor [Myxococcales bacterium]|nr:RNA polymerase sigma factor [Myxococcales bacterium]MBK7192965.1 RNA polymerase sigma factor [Myxococcales bacterium]MBP6849915.1 RNA polymerase sigma factor [Kofleriaceae bacterium]